MNPQIFTWSMTRATKFRFEELIMFLEQTDDEQIDEIETLKECIRSLPGFPAGANPETAHIYLDVTDVQN